VTALRELLAAVGRKMQVDFEEISKQTSHPGERGRAREDAVRTFLRQYLPGRVGVGQGLLVDHLGRTSRECDVVLYDAQSTPVFHVSDTVRLFPAETVFLVLQVKSRLSKSHLQSAVDNLASVARLSRSSEPAQPLLGGFAISTLFRGALRMTYTPDRVAGGVFAYDSPSLETLAADVVQVVRGRPREEWPVFVISLAKGAIVYGHGAAGGKSRLATGPLDQTRLVLLAPEDDHPLLLLYLVTVMRTQVTMSARPDLLSYLRLSGRGRWAPLDAAE